MKPAIIKGPALQTLKCMVKMHCDLSSFEAAFPGPSPLSSLGLMAWEDTDKREHPFVRPRLSLPGGQTLWCRAWVLRHGAVPGRPSSFGNHGKNR